MSSTNSRGNGHWKELGHEPKFLSCNLPSSLLAQSRAQTGFEVSPYHSPSPVLLMSHSNVEGCGLSLGFGVPGCSPLPLAASFLAYDRTLDDSVFLSLNSSTSEGPGLLCKYLLALP